MLCSNKLVEDTIISSGLLYILLRILNSGINEPVSMSFASIFLFIKSFAIK